MKKIALFLILVACFNYMLTAQPSKQDEVIYKAVPMAKKEFKELADAFDVLRFECNQPVECPQLDMANTKKLAEVIEKIIITHQRFKAWIEEGLMDNRSHPEWLAARDLVNKSYDHITHVQKDFYKAVSKVRIFPESYKDAPVYTGKDPYSAINNLNDRFVDQLKLFKRYHQNFMIKPYPYPTLRVPGNKFKPGQEITINFTARPCFSDDAWIGIIPSSTSHKNEAASEQNKLARKYIRSKTEGAFTFKLPETQGSYDFRMFDADENGKEVNSYSFEIVDSYTAADLQGNWEATGYNCPKPVTHEKIKIKLNGNKLIATKIVGDDCVPAGQVTWEGTLNEKAITGRGHVSSGVGTPLSWISITINVEDKNTLKGFYGCTYRRIK